MPLYDYQCTECDEVMELSSTYDMRDHLRQHIGCTGSLKRVFINAPKARKLTRYGGMQAVVVDRNERTVGHAKGHFGETAARKRRK